MLVEVPLFQAIRYFGSQKALAKAVGVSRQRIGYWLNGASISYDAAWEMVRVTKGLVNIDDLVPHQRALNQFIREWVNEARRQTEDISQLSKGQHSHAMPKNAFCLTELTESRPILINQNFQLLTCECQLKRYQNAGKKHVPVKVVELKREMMKENTLKQETFGLTLCERTTLGMTLETLFGNSRGNPLQSNNTAKWRQFKQKGVWVNSVAECVGLRSGRHFERAKRVIRLGCGELIQSMNQGDVSVSFATTLSKLSQCEQRHILNSVKKTHKEKS